MGKTRIMRLLLALMLAGCTLALPEGKADGPAPLATDAIEVTTLDAPKDAGAEPAQTATPAKPEKPEDPEKTEAPAPTDPVAPVPDAEAADGTADDKSEPTTPDATAAPEAKPSPAPLSPAALACQKKGGRYVKTGSGDLRACVKVTRDGGKSCKRETDCEGACLARSGTCAPQTPLFGCNEVFQADGRRVNLCLN